MNDMVFFFFGQRMIWSFVNGLAGEDGCIYSKKKAMGKLSLGSL